MAQDRSRSPVRNAPSGGGDRGGDRSYDRPPSAPSAKLYVGKLDLLCLWSFYHFLLNLFFRGASSHSRDKWVVRLECFWFWNFHQMFGFQFLKLFVPHQATFRMAVGQTCCETLLENLERSIWLFCCQWPWNWPISWIWYDFYGFLILV